MNEIEHYYQILGLQPGATEAEVREAYRTLVKVWHPDRFSGDPRLQEKAQEKLKEINAAYKWVLDYMAGQTDPEIQTEDEPATHYEHDHPGSAPPPPPGPPSGGPPPRPEQPSDPFPQVSRISWKPLTFYGGFLGFMIGQRVGKLWAMAATTAVEAGIFAFCAAVIFTLVGVLLGYGAAQAINRLTGKRNQKVALAWTVGILAIIPLVWGFSLTDPVFRLKQPLPSPKIVPTGILPGETEQDFSPDLIREMEDINREWRMKNLNQETSSPPPRGVQSFSGSRKESTPDKTHKLEMQEGPKQQALATSSIPPAMPSQSSTSIGTPPGESKTSMEKAVIYPGTLAPIPRPNVPKTTEIDKYSMGIALMEEGDYEKALPILQEAVKENPRHAEAYFQLGCCDSGLGRHIEAVEAYKQAIEMNPRLAEAYSWLSAAYLNLGHHQEAIDSLKQAIRVKPDLAITYYNLGSTYFTLGRYSEAVEPLCKATRIEPNHARAHYYLGLTYRKLKYGNSAFYEYEILSKLDHDLARQLINAF